MQKHHCNVLVFCLVYKVGSITGSLPKYTSNIAAHWTYISNNTKKNTKNVLNVIWDICSDQNHFKEKTAKLIKIQIYDKTMFDLA